MTLLALDTSTPVARVAVMDAGGSVLAIREVAAVRHSATLLASCDDALRAARAAPSDLSAVACGRGPGSFTGLRVGMALAKGLCLVTGSPLVLVSSLHALAEDLALVVPAPDIEWLVPCIDAGKDEVYAGLFRRAGSSTAEPASEEWALRPEALCRAAPDGRAALGGNGAERYRDVLTRCFGLDAVRTGVPGPSAVAVGRLALARLARGETDDLAGAVPSYGRPPDITQPRPRR